MTLTLMSTMSTMIMNKPKKIPLRKCVVTQERLDKKDLIRVVRTKENTVEIDLTGKKNGRGAYLKLDKEVIALAKKQRKLSRVFSMEVEDTLYEELMNLVK